MTFDDLSVGFHNAVLGGKFVQGSLYDKAALCTLFGAHRFDAIMHFAGSIAVGESMRDPAVLSEQFNRHIESVRCNA